MKIAAFVVAAVFAATTCVAGAQAYPTKPVTLLVPQAPGGATDVFARRMAKELGDKWGQPVVVENKPGAAGVIGTGMVAKAAPDGYTLLLTYAGSQAVNPSLYSKLPFDSVKDFSTVATVATTPFFLVVGPQSPIRTVGDLLARAKANPGKITYASSGNGSINHLLGESLNVEAGVQTQHIPYKGVAASLTDVISGNVDYAFASVPSSLQLIKGGKLRAVAVSSARRNPSLPEVPTIAESGHPQFDVNPWWGILAPAGTPQPIVDQISADVAQILRTPQSQAFFREQGAEALITAPDAFHRMLENDVVKWGKVVKASGAKLD